LNSSPWLRLAQNRVCYNFWSGWSKNLLGNLVLFSEWWLACLSFFEYWRDNLGWRLLLWCHKLAMGINIDLSSGSGRHKLHHDVWVLLHKLHDLLPFLLLVPYRPSFRRMLELGHLRVCIPDWTSWPALFLLDYWSGFHLAVGKLPFEVRYQLEGAIDINHRQSLPIRCDIELLIQDALVHLSHLILHSHVELLNLAIHILENVILVIFEVEVVFVEGHPVDSLFRWDLMELLISNWLVEVNTWLIVFVNDLVGVVGVFKREDMLHCRLLLPVGQLLV